MPVDIQARVIASSESLPPGTTSERYAQHQGELLRQELQEYEEVSFGATKLFGGRRGFLRRFRWTPPEHEEITQVQLYYVEVDRGYTATATTPSAIVASTEEVLLAILDGLAIERSATPGSPSG